MTAFIVIILLLVLRMAIDDNVWVGGDDQSRSIRFRWTMMQMQGFVVVVAVRCLLFVVGVVSSPAGAAAKRKRVEEKKVLFLDLLATFNLAFQ